jgi:hypothetical protein
MHQTAFRTTIPKSRRSGSLNALVEKRDGKPGIDIEEMDIVAAAAEPKEAKRK